MKKFTVLVLAGIAALLSLPTFAKSVPTATNTTFNKFNTLLRNIYVDGNVGAGKVKEDIRVARNDHNEGVAWNIGAGYKFCKYGAGEFSYSRYHDEEFGNNTARGIDNKSYQVAAKAMYPLPQWKLSPFVKLGPAWVTHTARDGGRVGSDMDGFAIYSAAGVAVLPWNNTSINFQVSGTRNHAGTPAMYMYSAGLSYMFG